MDKKAWITAGVTFVVVVLAITAEKYLVGPLAAKVLKK